MPNPERLGIRTWVDGELRQDGNTSELIYSFGEMIEELTQVFTLEPGDILATGTPSASDSASIRLASFARDRRSGWRSKPWPSRERVIAEPA